MSTDTKKLVQSQCEVCSACYECGKLFSALTVLHEMPNNLTTIEQQNKLLALSEHLRELGYSYPISDSFCSLAHQPKEVRLKTEQAIKLINEFMTRFHTRVGKKSDAAV